MAEYLAFSFFLLLSLFQIQISTLFSWHFLHIWSILAKIKRRTTIMRNIVKLVNVLLILHCFAFLLLFPHTFTSEFGHIFYRNYTISVIVALLSICYLLWKCVVFFWGSHFFWHRFMMSSCLIKTTHERSGGHSFILLPVKAATCPSKIFFFISSPLFFIFRLVSHHTRAFLRVLNKE